MSDVFKFVCMSYNDISVDSERYNAFLHKIELEKIKKAVEKRRLEFLFGRLCAKEAYASLYNAEIDFKELCILNDCFGAPYFDNKSCLVNITHDAGLAAAIVYDRNFLHVGIDVQKILPQNTQTIDRILSENEKNILQKQSSFFSKDYLYSAVWVAKEALSKLLGYGFSVLNSLEICSIEQTDCLIVNFLHFKGFQVILRDYKDYLFGFAAQKDEAGRFSANNLTISETVPNL